MASSTYIANRPRLPLWLLAAALVLGTIFAYKPAWHAGFVSDDELYVTRDPLLTAPDGLRRIWFSQQDSPSQYFPLTYSVFRLEHSFWGLLPDGYHAVNILLHSINALLVWLVLRRLRVPGSWLAAAMFALHPVQVESVAWVSELKNVLSLFFKLLALLAWIEFIEEQSRPSWPWYLFALTCQALALTGKTTACTLPAALLLILWLKHKPINRLRLAQVAPFLMMSLAMGLVTVWWERHYQGTHGKPFALGLPERLLVASHAFWFYLGKLIWPVNLMFSYPRWSINPANPLDYGWMAALAGLALSIAFLRRFFGRSIEVAISFYGLTLSPLLGFIMLYTFLYTFVADHYQYVACIGPFALAGAGISKALEILGKNQKSLLKAAVYGALLLTLAVLTWKQSRIYTNGLTLWRDTVERNPSSWMARANLGDYLVAQGQIDESIRQFQESIRLNPDFVMAHIDLGTDLLRQNRTVEAQRQFEEAVRLEPDNGEAHLDLGTTLLEQNRIDEAQRQFEEAVRLKEANRLEPDVAEAHMNLGIALLNQGRTDDAISQYQTAIRLKPDYADAHYNLGVALFGQGHMDEAIRQFQQVIRLKPDYAEAHNNLGAALLQKGKTDDAIRQFYEAIHLKPDYADAQNNLATALELTNKPVAVPIP